MTAVLLQLTRRQAVTSKNFPRVCLLHADASSAGTVVNTHFVVLETMVSFKLGESSRLKKLHFPSLAQSVFFYGTSADSLCVNL